MHLEYMSLRWNQNGRKKFPVWLELISGKHNLKTSPHQPALLEHSLCFKYMITIVNSVSVIKVKPNGLSYMDLFYTAWAHVTKMTLQRLTFVVIQNISLVDYILCHEMCEKV